MAMGGLVNQFEALPLNETTTNIDKVNEAFWNQVEYLEEFRSILVKEDNRCSVDFTKPEQRGRILRDVFIMLQNWSAMDIKAEDGSSIRDITVTVPIGGKVYKFRMERTMYNQIIVYNPEGKLRQYNELFDSANMKEYEVFVTNMVEFMLKVTFSTLDKNGEKQLEYWNQGHANCYERVEGKEDYWWSLFCDIMVIAQVAEAARPDEEFFVKWMRAAEAISGELKGLTGEIKRTAYFQKLRNVHGITRSGQFSGRVPYADAVFRKMLCKMQGDLDKFANKTFEEVLQTYFPISKKKSDDVFEGTEFQRSGANHGRYHILFDKWIRESSYTRIYHGRTYII